MENKFKGVWIDAEVMTTEGLTPTEKIILSIIKGMSEKGCFYAGNSYMSKLVGVSERQVSRAIGRLSEGEFITIHSPKSAKRWIEINKEGKADYYYVYKHVDYAGKVFYIGYGKGNRLNSTDDKNEAWKQASKNGFEAKIIIDNLSKSEAIKREYEEKMSYGLDNLTNNPDNMSKKVAKTSNNNIVDTKENKIVNTIKIKDNNFSPSEVDGQYLYSDPNFKGEPQF